MKIREARRRIYEFRVAGGDTATLEVDVGCEFRTGSSAPLLHFVPGRNREREERRVLQECRHRHAILSEEGSRRPRSRD